MSLATGQIKDERVQLVDAVNRPCGSASRRMMRRYRLWHRATYVFVRNRLGELCVQERTLTKEVFPGDYDLATGGVVGAGEAVAIAARRELAEELGIESVRLTPCFEFRFAEQGHHVFGSVFLVDYDGPLRLQAEEVASANWLSVAEALDLRRATPDTHRALTLMCARHWLG
ncbi:Isopentenyldiphosphate isomerase [Modicisalibacter ilicicola DSM 19980]|uniref:Isopentenyldiphosphate isomerase n=1 Tax=Modicisalibacter ilicicola DSM 19980 TaxID=1121942 RepID=A0A1M4T640_9GAMM|nr:NUDIX domain-containing protein [Halomonas ilicicola]SHE39895.1 Isopentenyldiphosphate isomerase [Halomonas ilicicola DSM 19980]